MPTSGCRHRSPVSPSPRPRSRCSADGSPRDARWQSHWAFIPPERLTIPRVGRQEWVRNPIDAFILAWLEREGLAPSPEAERGILLRRVTLDLTGLPPTLAEIDVFERDTAPDAYEKVVDRLLASPRFGERMAIRWLNAARYADTNGYQTDAPRIMWRWRDWVIDAYNRNMPFDRFTIEQLAGDLIPDATLEQQIATGFNRNHRGNAEGGIIPEEYAVEYVVDRVDTTATVWLGLTVGCARCHSHKFDPITQEDYYRLFAFFNNVPENGRAVKYGNSPPFIKAPTRDQQEQLDRLQTRLTNQERRLQRREPEIASTQAAWESSIRNRPAFEWLPEEHLVVQFRGRRGGAGSPGLVTGPVGRAFLLDGRESVDAGDVAGFGFYDKFTLAAWIKPSGPRGGTIISRMADQPQGEGYSVVLDQGKVQVNLVKRWLDDAIRVETKGTVPIGRWTHVAVTYDGSRVAGGIQVYLDGQLAPLAVLLDELNQSFETKQPLRIGAGGGPEARFEGAIDEPVIYDRGARSGEHRDPGDIRVDHEDRGDPLRTPDARPGIEDSPLFPGDRGPGNDQAAGHASRFGAGRHRCARRANPHDDGHAGDAGAAPDARPDPRAVRSARAPGRPRRAGFDRDPCSRDGRPIGWDWLAGLSIRRTR